MKFKERIKKAWNIIFNINDNVPSIAFGNNMDSEFHDKYLFDFKKGYMSGNFNNTFVLASPQDSMTMESNSNENKPPQKITIKPIDVLNELETIPSPISLGFIDEKIHILKEKEKLITQKYVKREIEALIFRLENRKKYAKHKKFFDQFQNTTEENVSKLTEKYKLVMKESDLFIPEFPDEAIKTMTEYNKIVKKMCGKEPVYYVIAEEKDFKSKFEKRDPILLVQSPFGFYFQILGAWDKELILLSEL